MAQERLKASPETYKGTAQIGQDSPRPATLTISKVPRATSVEDSANLDWLDAAYSEFDIRRYGLIGGTSDDTTELTDFFDTLDEDLDFIFVIPDGFTFNKQLVINSLPEGVKIINDSGFDWNEAATRSRFFGPIAKDSGDNDSGICAESGHHAILILNNYDLAGTTSANLRKASIFWSAGVYQDAGVNSHGQRSASSLQWNNRAGSPEIWDFSLIQWAPGDAVKDGWELWSSGTTYTVGEFILASNDQHYKCTVQGGGTSTNEPAHTDGTTVAEADGYSWDHIGTSGATLWTVDEFGRQAWGGESIGGFFDTRPNIHDPNGGANTHTHSARGTSKDVTIIFKPTDSGDSLVTVPQIRADGDDAALYIYKSDSSTSLVKFTDDGGLDVKEFAYTEVQVSSGSTPDADGRHTIYLTHSSPTSITDLLNGDDGQEVRLIPTTANITFVHSSTFNLTGSANITTPAAYSVITMQKVPSAISNRWVMVSGDLK